MERLNIPRFFKPISRGGEENKPVFGNISHFSQVRAKYSKSQKSFTKMWIYLSDSNFMNEALRSVTPRVSLLFGVMTEFYMIISPHFILLFSVLENKELFFFVVKEKNTELYNNVLNKKKIKSLNPR